MASLPRDFLAYNFNLTARPNGHTTAEYVHHKIAPPKICEPGADLWLLKVSDALIVCLLFLRGEASPLSRAS